jgi:signal peptidase I
VAGIVAVGALVLATTPDSVAGSMIVLVAGFLAVVSLWRAAGQARPGRRPVSQRGTGWTATRSWLLIGVLSVAAMLLVRTFVVQSMVVVSDSMDDTLHTGDRLVLDKLGFRTLGLQPGDVVVLRRPEGVAAPAGDLVKRVIGLPGDRLTEDAGRVVRNGAPLTEPYLRPGCGDEAAGLGTVVVPAGKVFVMGDNRCHSLDSRSFGPIDETLIAGRAAVITWPLNRFGVISGQ